METKNAQSYCGRGCPFCSLCIFGYVCVAFVDIIIITISYACSKMKEKPQNRMNHNKIQATLV